MTQLLVVLPLLISGVEPSRRAAVVTRVAVAPVIDGSLAEWSPGLFAVSPPLTIASATSVIEEGTISADADHAVELWLTTTPGTLHLAAQVTDDLVQAGAVAPDLWKDDGLELLVEARTGALVHLGFNARGLVWRFGDGTGAVSGVAAAARTQRPGFMLEASIPLALLGLTDATLDGARVNFAARDVDGAAVAHRVWSGLRHTQRASLGTLTVVKAMPSAALVPRCPVSKRTVTIDAPLKVQGAQVMAKGTPVTLRLVNYQPADRPWARQWTEFDLEQTARDFSRAAQVGANAVRLFVFYAPFGEHQVSPVMLQRLRSVVDLAAKAGLLCVVSFFPFDKEFRRQAWPGMGKHLETIVSAFVGHPAIAMWDLMNEPDHAWALADAGTDARAVYDWATEMTAVVKRADPTHLVTVGLAGHFATRDGGIDSIEALPFVDVISVHGYFDEAAMPNVLKNASSLGKPVVLQEYGRTRLQWTTTETAQFDTRICSIARAARVAGIGAWELFDHPVGSIDWLETPWREAPESWFGLLSSAGVPWPRAKAFCECLDAPTLRFSASK